MEFLQKLAEKSGLPFVGTNFFYQGKAAFPRWLNLGIEGLTVFVVSLVGQPDPSFGLAPGIDIRDPEVSLNP